MTLAQHDTKRSGFLMLLLLVAISFIVQWLMQQTNGWDLTTANCVDWALAILLPLVVLIIKNNCKAVLPILQLSKWLPGSLFIAFGVYFLGCLLATFRTNSVGSIVLLRTLAPVFTTLLPFAFAGRMLMKDRGPGASAAFLYSGLLACSFVLEKNFRALATVEDMHMLIRQSGILLVLGAGIAGAIYVVQRFWLTQKVAAKEGV